MHEAQLTRKELLGIAALVLLEQLRGKVEMSELVVEHSVPYRFDARIRFLLDTAIVQILPQCEQACRANELIRR
jgi:hypothetical protein